MKLVPSTTPGHSAHTCHWSVPTLLMPRPYWLSASEAPWCCWNEHNIVVLSTTEGCLQCPIWKPRREADGRGGNVQPEGAVPLTSS